jgi:hypothetical protein
MTAALMYARLHTSAPPKRKMTMKKKTRLLYAGLPALLAALLALPGCQNPSDSGGGNPPLQGTAGLFGSPTVGGTLYAETGALEGTGDISYQWIQGESAVIQDAAGESYIPVADDIGETIKVRVSRAGYAGTVDSAPAGPITNPVKGRFDYSLGYQKVIYFSLSQGIELDESKKNTGEWDIAFETGLGFLYIYTNSGSSAAAFGSPGRGGVWFTEKTDFNDTVFEDRVTDFSGDYAEYEGYVTDVTKYQHAMAGSVPGPMNIMTYYGYRTGSGDTEEDPFEWSIPGPPGYPFYEFNKKAFAYVNGGMPPPWFPTRRVYIIRHGDGEHYSKFQVSALRYEKGFTFVFTFRFEMFE